MPKKEEEKNIVDLKLLNVTVYIVLYHYYFDS